MLLSVLEYFRTLRPLHAVFWITFLCLGVYSNAIQHPFVHDDFIFIVNNPSIQNFDLLSIWGRPVFSLGGDPSVNTYYRPFLELVYRLQYAFFGMNATGYHLINVLIHWVNGCLLYCLFQKLYPSQRFLPFALAVIFIVHPIQTEAVAAIAGISNTLVLMWSLVALVFVLNYVGSHSVVRLTWLMSAGFAFLLALFTKELAIGVPVLMVAGIRVFEKSRGIRVGVGKPLILMAGVAVIYFLFRNMMLGAPLHFPLHWDYETQTRLLSIPGMLVMYLGLLLWPSGLHYYRSYDISQPFWLGIVILMVVGATFCWIYFKAPRAVQDKLRFGLLWFFLPLLPVMNIIPLVNEYSLVMAAEHFLYWPMIGAVLIVVSLAQWLGPRVITRRWQPSVFGCAVWVVVLLANASIRQNMTWAGEIPLFERMVTFQPSFGRGRMLLAKAYYRADRWDDGVAQYQKGLAIMRRYTVLTGNHPVRKVYQKNAEDIMHGMIFGLERSGRFNEARPYYKSLFEQGYRQTGLLNALALNYAQTGDCGQATRYWQEALERSPDDLQMVTSLGLCYETLQNWERARSCFQTVAEREPQSEEAQVNLKRIRRIIDEEKR